MKKYFFLFLAMATFMTFALTNGVHAEDTAEGEATPEPQLLFVELNPLIIPVINNSGVTQMVSLVVAVEVDSQEKADKVTKYSPRLTDAYLSELYGSFSREAPDNGIIPIGYVKERLNKTGDKVLGEEVISDVLVQVLQSRRT